MDRPVDRLTDEQLLRLNESQDWRTCTLDGAGRQVGLVGGPVYEIPAPLVTKADKRFRLAGRSVVEFGCLEGAHTIALAERAAAIKAVDARQDNLMKAAVRCAMYGVWPQFGLYDVENEMPRAADLYFHSGVLYHLQDPVRHLYRVAARAGILVLDTHHTKKPDKTYRARDGQDHPVWIYPEKTAGAKAGVRDFSRWLTLDGIVKILSRLYSKVEVVSDRAEPNGPRTTIFASHNRNAAGDLGT